MTDALDRNEWTVFGTTRSAEKAQRLSEKRVSPVIWRDRLDLSFLTNASAFLISTPPETRGCPSLSAVASWLAANRSRPEWIGYLSTNGVYGDYGGAWVNEMSERRGASDRARRRIKAEDDWVTMGQDFDLPVKIFRLPSIYGPGRSALDTVLSGAAKRIFKKGQVFSRAHVHDIATTLLASMATPSIGEIFNIADDEPAPPQDVIAYACELLNAPIPPLIPLEAAALSSMAKSFYQDNKRVSNKLIKELLNIELQYPTYKEGLDAIHAAREDN